MFFQLSISLNGCDTEYMHRYIPCTGVHFEMSNGTFQQAIVIMINLYLLFIIYLFIYLFNQLPNTMNMSYYTAQ